MTPFRALAVLTCCLALAACGDAVSDPANPTPPRASSAPSDVTPSADPGGISAPVGPNAAALYEPCQPEPDTVIAGQGDVAVRPDPVRARVCIHPLADTQPPGAEPALPSYYLAEAAEASRLAALYADLRPASGDQACTADIGSTASVLFEYEDGAAVAVLTELYGCSASRVSVDASSPLTVSKLAELRAELERIGRSSKPYEEPLG